MTDILQSLLTQTHTHTHTHTHTRTHRPCTHSDLPSSPPSAPKQIIAFTQPDINLFRLACVLKGTTTTTTLVNSTYISCTSQIIVRVGERKKTAKGAVKQNGDASGLSATECKEMWQSAGGGFQIHFLLLSVHISRWRRICWFLLCSIMEGRWMWKKGGGLCKLVHTCPKMMRLLWSVPMWATWTAPPPGTHTHSHTHTYRQPCSLALCTFVALFGLCVRVCVCVCMCVWFWLTPASCFFRHHDFFPDTFVDSL